MVRLLTQPSSWAGYAAIAATVFHAIGSNGFPSSITGWLGLLVPIAAGAAAVLRDEAHSIPAP